MVNLNIGPTPIEVMFDTKKKTLILLMNQVILKTEEITLKKNHLRCLVAQKALYSFSLTVKVLRPLLAFV